MNIKTLYNKSFLKLIDVMNVFNFDFASAKDQSYPVVYYENTAYIEVNTFFHIFFKKIPFIKVEVDFFNSTIMMHIKYIDNDIIKRLSNVKLEYTITESRFDGTICLTFIYK